MAFTLDSSSNAEAWSWVLGFVMVIITAAGFSLTRLPKLVPKLQAWLQKKAWAASFLMDIIGTVSETYLVLLNLAVLLGAVYNIYYIGPIEASDATGVAINENGFINSCGLGAIFILVPHVVPNLWNALMPVAQKDEIGKASSRGDIILAHIYARLGVVRTGDAKYTPLAQILRTTTSPYLWYFAGLANLTMFITRDLDMAASRLATVISIAFAAPFIVGLVAGLIDATVAKQRAVFAIGRVAMLEAALVLLSSSAYIALRTASRSSLLDMVQGTGDDVIGMSVVFGVLGAVSLALNLWVACSKASRSDGRTAVPTMEPPSGADL
jgi:hypothetical protein